MTAGRKIKTNSVDWNTPPKYVELIERFFNDDIELDPCSNTHSLIRAKHVVILPNDGLKIEWNYKTIFINPPYGRDSVKKTSIYDWIEKGKLANVKYGSECLFLIPVATNTSHFKDIIFKHYTAICFLNDTRLKFMLNGILDGVGAPMACCLCYVGNRYDEFVNVFSNSGKIFKI